jgi:type VI protein secretion system component Hcp
MFENFRKKGLRNSKAGSAGSRKQQRSAGQGWYRPRLEALEDRTLLSNFDFAGLAQDLRDNVASPIQSLLQQARAIPFIGQQLATVAQVIQPAKDAATAIGHINGQIPPQITGDGFTLDITQQSNQLNCQLQIQTPAAEATVNNLSFDLGLGDFLKVHGTSGFSVSAVVTATLSFSFTDGGDFSLSDQPNAFAVTVSANLGSSFSVAAVLGGLLEATVTNQQTTSINPLTFTAGGSSLTGTVSLGIKNGALTAPSFNGEAMAHLHLSLGLDPSLNLPLNPQLGADLNLDWKFDAGHPDGNLGHFSFDNVYFDVGASIPTFFEPIIQAIQTVTEPLQPIVTFLNTEVPIINDFGIHMRFRDLLSGELGSGFGDVVDAICLINQISFSNGNQDFRLPLGSFHLADANQFFSQGLEDLANQAASIVPNEVLQAGQDLLNQVLPEMPDGGIGDFLGDSEGSFPTSFQPADGQIQDGVHFPIFENPQGAAFQLLMGRNVDLFTFRMPSFTHTFSGGATLGIPGLLGIYLTGAIKPAIDLAGGYDTTGLKEAVGDFASGKREAGTLASDLFDGFYFDNTETRIANPLDGNQRDDIHHATGIDLFGALSAGFQVGFAGLGGTISANLSLGLNANLDDDPTRPDDPRYARVRLSKLIDALANGDNPFELSGKVSASAEFTISVGISGLFNVDLYKYTLAETTLLNFDLLSGQNKTTKPAFPQQIVVNLLDGPAQTIYVTSYSKAYDFSDSLADGYPGFVFENGIEVDYRGGPNIHKEFYPTSYFTVPFEEFNNRPSRIGWSDAKPLTPDSLMLPLPPGPYFIVTDQQYNPSAGNVILPHQIAGDKHLIVDPSQVDVIIDKDTSAILSAPVALKNNSTNWNGVRGLLVGGGGDDDLEWYNAEGPTDLYGEGGNDVLIGGGLERGAGFPGGHIPYLPLVDKNIIDRLNFALNVNQNGYDKLIASGSGFADLYAGPGGAYMQGGGTDNFYGSSGNNWFEVAATDNVTISGGSGQNTVHLVDVSSQTQLFGGQSPELDTMALTASANGEDLQLTKPGEQTIGITMSQIQNLVIDSAAPNLGVPSVQPDLSISLPDPSTIPQLQTVTVNFRQTQGVSTLTVNGIRDGHNDFTVGTDKGNDVLITDLYHGPGIHFSSNRFTVLAKGLVAQDVLQLNPARRDEDFGGNAIAPQDTVTINLDSNNFFFETDINFDGYALKSLSINAAQFAGKQFSPLLGPATELDVQDNEVDYSALKIGPNGFPDRESGKIKYFNDALQLTLTGPKVASTITVSRPTTTADTSTTVNGGNGNNTFIINDSRGQVKVTGGSGDDNFTASGTGSYILDGGGGNNTYTINFPTYLQVPFSAQTTINDQGNPNGFDHVIINGQPPDSATRTSYAIGPSSTAVHYQAGFSVKASAYVMYRDVVDVTLNTDKQGFGRGTQTTVVGTSVTTFIKTGPGANTVSITPPTSGGQGASLEALHKSVTVTGGTGITDLLIYDQANSNTIPGGTSYKTTDKYVSRNNAIGINAAGRRGGIANAVYYSNINNLTLYENDARNVPAGTRTPVVDSTTVTGLSAGLTTIADATNNLVTDNLTIQGLGGTLELTGNRSGASLHFSGALQMSPVLLAVKTPNVGNPFTLVDNDSAAAWDRSTFSNAPVSKAFQMNGLNYDVNYQVPSNETPAQPDVVLTYDNTPPSNIRTDLSSLALWQEGQLISGHVYFTDPDVNDTHTVTIDWGDNSTPDVINLAAGVDSTPISHTYLDEGQYNVFVTVDDSHPARPDVGIGPGQVTTEVNIFRVMDAPLTLGSAAPALTEGVNNNVLVATFTDANPDSSNSDFHAIINWGDGTTTFASADDGTIVRNGASSFQVFGSHQYAAEEGAPFYPSVTIADVGGAAASTPLTWQSAGNALVASEGAASARGSDGRIYVLGGPGNRVRGSSAPRVFFESFDPATNIWTRLTDLPASVKGIALAAGNDGKIYAFGGSTGSGTAAKAYVYDPATNAWQTLANMPQPAAYAAAVTFPDETGYPDGLIYVLGGERILLPGLPYVKVLNTLQVYNPATGTWSMGPSMPTARSHLAAVLGCDFKIYALGGQDSANAAQEAAPLTTMEVFDPSAQSWTPGPNMPQRLADFAAVASPAPTGLVPSLGLIYALGAGAPIEAFNMEANNWFTENVSVDRSLFAAAAGSDGRVYVIDGLVSNGGAAAPSNSVLVLQPSPVSLGDAALVPDSSFTINATETVPFSGPLASFTDPGNDGTTNDYSGSFTWGGVRSQPRPAQFQLNSDGSISVIGSFDYPTAGTYTATIAVQDKGGAIVNLQGTVQVGTLLADVTQPTTANAIEGTSLDNQVLATFTYPDPNATESEFSAAIDWNDQSQPDVSTGAVQKISQDSTQSTFQVVGSHIYGEAGKYHPLTTITPVRGSSITSQQTAISVADVALIDTTPQTTIAATVGINTDTQVVATFMDPNSYAQLDYIATIDWGDGTVGHPDTTSGTVLPYFNAATGVHGDDVVGDHTYSSPGTYRVHVTVGDKVDTILDVVASNTVFQVGAGSVGVTFDTGSGPGPEFAVQSYAWGGSEPFANGVATGKATLQDFQLTLAPATVDPGIWNLMATNVQLVHVTVHVRDAFGHEYLTYALDNAGFSGFQTGVNGSTAPVDRVTLAFGQLTEDYKVLNPDGSVVSDNKVKVDIVSGGGGGSLSPPALPSPPPVGITFDTGSGPGTELAVQSFAWGASQPFVNGNATGQVNVSDFQLTLAASSIEPALWGTMITNRQLVHATLHVRDGSGREYLTYTFDNAQFSSFQISASNGAAPTDRVTLVFQHVTEDYKRLDPFGGVGFDNQAQFDLTSGASGGKLSPPHLASPPMVGITFDTGSGPGAEMAVQSFSWGGRQSIANGQPNGAPNLADFQVLLDPSSVEPGLWSAMLGNLPVYQAVIHVRDAGGNEYLTYTLQNAMFSAFALSETGGAAPVDELLVSFKEATEDYKVLNPDGSVAFDNQAQFGFPNSASGSLSPPALPAPPSVGITFDTGGGPGAELAVESFSWGASQPFVNGSATARASVQDFQVTLAPSSTEPGLWGAMISNSPLAHATIHVRDASGNEYLTYALDNVLISSFQVGANGTAPIDRITLAFQRVTEDYKVLNPDGSAAFDNQAKHDLSNGGGGGSLSPPALASPLQVGITFDTGSGPGNEIAVQSFSWGGSDPYANGSATAKASVQDFQLTLDPSSVEPGLWGTMLTNRVLVHVTVHERDASGHEYLTYTFDNAHFSSFQIGASGGAAPIDRVTLAFTHVTEDYKVLNPDGSVASDDQAQLDISNGGGGGSLSPPALAAPPTVGITFDTGNGPGAELAVQGFSWGASQPFANGSATARVNMQDFQLTLDPSSVEPALWGAMVGNVRLVHATIHVRDAAGNEYLTYTLDNAGFSGFQTSSNAGTTPVDRITLAFTKVTQGGPAAPTLTLNSSAYPAGIVSAYQADGNANDAIGSNNGAIQGNVTFVPGHQGQAFEFDGVNSAVVVPASPSLNVGTGSFTLAAWINPSDVSTKRPILEWTNGMHLWISVTYGGAVGPANLYANLDVPTSAIISSAAGAIQANTWQFVALTWDQSTDVARLFLNGNQVAQQTFPGITPNTTGDLAIGRRLPYSNDGYPVPFSGGIDDVGIYNRALTAGEIGSLFTSTGSPSQPGQAVVITATVSSPPNTPAGNVSFTVDDGAAQTVAVTNGEAQITLGNPGTGSHSITAVYTPADSNLQGSQASFTQAVQGRPAITWINSAGGDWDTASNWSGGVVPGPNDDVVINVSPAVTITHAQNVTDTVKSVTASDPLVLSGGTLSITGQLNDSANVYIGNGNLANATVTSGTSLLTRPPNFFRTGSTLQDIILAGSLTYNNIDDVYIAGAGLTLAGGTITIDNGSTLNFSGAQTLGGTGTVHFAGRSSNGPEQFNVNGAGSKLTIGTGVTINGTGGVVNAGGATLDNKGTINADTASNSSLTVTGSNWTNDGLLEATGGGLVLAGAWTNNAGHQILVNAGYLSFGGSWSNQGTVTSQGAATVYLGGTFGLANLGSYSRDAGGQDTFVITGTLNLAGQTLDASAGPGPWVLDNATVIGGTVNVLLKTNDYNAVYYREASTLQDVTLAGTLQWDSIRQTSDTIDVAGGGLTLAAGTITIANGGSLNFSGTQTLGGSGTVVFAGPSSNGREQFNVTGAGSTLTIAPGVTIRGYGGNINAGTNTIANQGTITCGTPSSFGITVTATVNNAGTLQANGGSLIVAGPVTNTGTMQALAGGNLTLQSATAINQSGLLAGDAGASIAVDGNLLGTTTNAAGYSPQAAVTLAGSGTSAAPQMLEAMSSDLGNVAAGFTSNFAYGPLALANSTYVQLVDNAHNSAGTGAEAVYADSLTLPAGATLDLNGLHFYARTAQINGTVVNGSVSLVGPPITWINSAGGDWDTPGNWSGGVVPGPNDAVVINVSPVVTVTHSQNVTDTVSSLTASDPITLSAGTLNVTGTFSNSSAVALSGGTLGQATVAAGTTINATADSTLTAVTLAGTLSVNGGATVTVNQGLTLNNGTVQLNGYNVFNFAVFTVPAILRLAGSGTQTLGGTGQVIFAGTLLVGSAQPDQVDVLDSNAGPLVVGPGISVVDTTAGGTLGSSSEPLTLDGKVTATSGHIITVTGSAVSNAGSGGTTASLQASGGTLQVTNLQANAGGISGGSSGALTLDGSWQNDGAISGNNATLNLNGSWQNNGTITTTQSTVNLGGSFSQATLGSFTPGSSTVNIGGTLNNAGTTLALSNATDTWNLAGGTISGGTVSTVSQVQLTATASSTLTGVTLAGALSVNGGVTVTVNQGLTLNNGTVQLNGYNVDNFSVFTVPAIVRLAGSGAQTLGGTGQVIFAGTLLTGTAQPDQVNTLDSNAGPLVIAAGVSVTDTSAGGTLGNSAQALTIDGTVTASAGHIIAATGSSVSNAGAGGTTASLQATGGTLEVTNLQSNAGGASAASNGTLTLDGSWQSDGAISATNATVNLNGSWQNNGAITAIKSTVNLAGSFTLATLGNFSPTSSTVNIMGSLNNTGTTLALSDAGDTWNLTGGSISGGTVSTVGQVQLTATASSTLTGVTLAGALSVNGGVTVTVNQDLTLNNGTVQFNGYNVDNFSVFTVPAIVRLAGSGAQTLGGTGQIIFAGTLLTGTAQPDQVDTLDSNAGPLVIAAGVSVTDTSAGGTLGNSAENLTINGNVTAGGGHIITVTGASVTNAGTLQANGGSLIVAGPVTDTGTLQSLAGGSLTLQGAAAINQSGILAGQSGASITVAGNLLGSTANASGYGPQATVTLAGSGTSAAPQLLEAMSNDLGGVVAGFSNNFAYGAVALANNTYVQLVDNAHNSSGTGAEAVYATSLTVAAGTTLDLNGLHFYARTVQINGTIVNGSVTLVP